MPGRIQHMRDKGYEFCTHTRARRDSSVGIETGYEIDGRGFESREG
jgi:hypothetical protein